MKTLVLYIPAIHQGYWQLFEKYRGSRLFILGADILDDYPILKREIRALTPEQARDLLSSTDFFSDVSVATKEDLKKLAASDQRLILSHEELSDDLARRYFSRSKVIREDVFLRYDAKTVKEARKEVAYTGTVTKAKFQREVIKRLNEEKLKSGDWFLQLAAALIIEGKQKQIGHNSRQPAEHSMFINGDPRMYVVYGTDTHMRTGLHAEQSVIAQAAKEGVKTQEAELYVTTFPCPDCTNLIIAAGIKRLYFVDGYSELSSDDNFKNAGVEIFQVK